MAGNVTQIRSSEQIAYRLGGDRALSGDQVAYRLGLTTDARTVTWIGAGATARTLGVTSGEPVTGADVAKVQAIMEGVNPVTGEVLVAPKIEVAPTAKVAAVPAYDAIVLAAASQGKAPTQLFASVRGKAEWGRLERAVKAKGDFHRVPAFRLATLGAVVGVDVSAAYPAPEWEAAMAAKDERVTVGVKAYDVRLTLPKGASLALIMDTSGHRAQRTELWSWSARTAYEALAAQVAYGVRGHHGNGATAQRVAGTGFVGTVTVEATSRAGDPHLHAHSMIANLTICEDGTARTIGAGGRDVMAHGDWTAELAQLTYRTESARLGLASWAWNPTIRKYDDASISTAAKELGSKRHTAIDNERGAFEASGRAVTIAVDRRAENITRGGKEGDVETLEQIEYRFGRELAEAEVPLHGPNNLVEHDSPTWDVQRWNKVLDAELTEHQAVFTRVRMETAIMRHLPAGTLDQVRTITNDVLAHVNMIEARSTAMSARLRDGERFVTATILQAEQTVYSLTSAGMGGAHHTLSTDQADMALATYELAHGFTLNGGQRETFRRWTTGGNAIDLTIGAAGTGKTACSDAAVFALRAAGLRVHGISTAGIAAQNLAEATGVDVSSAYGLVKAISENRAPGMDVLIWDEMGMAGAREQATVLAWAKANRVDVRGMGDHKQLDSVAAGSTFGTQCELVSANELTENMRQAHRHERDAVAALRDGDVLVALGIYKNNGQVVVSPTPTDRVAAMAAAWALDAAREPDPFKRLKTAVMLSQTNECVDALGAASRVAAREHGWLTGGDVSYRGPGGTRVAFAVGDAVLAKETLYKTSHDSQPTLFNGQRGIVRNIDPQTRAMTVDWIRDGQRHSRKLSAGYVGSSVRSGFVLTNHGAQGQNIAHVHADPTALALNAAYVQWTRDVEQLTIYTDLEALEATVEDRVQLATMTPDQRTEWSVQQLAQQITDRGWSVTETAHDATGQAVPMPGWQQRALGTLTDDQLRHESAAQHARAKQAKVMAGYRETVDPDREQASQETALAQTLRDQAQADQAQLAEDESCYRKQIRADAGAAKTAGKIIADGPGRFGKGRDRVADAEHTLETIAAKYQVPKSTLPAGVLAYTATSWSAEMLGGQTAAARTKIDDLLARARQHESAAAQATGRADRNQARAELAKPAFDVATEKAAAADRELALRDRLTPLRREHEQLERQTHETVPARPIGYAERDAGRELPDRGHGV